MIIDERTDGEITILRPQGRLTVETFGHLKDRVRHDVSRGRVKLVLNLAAVPYADSIGIAEIVRAHVILKTDGGRLALTDLPEPVAELFSLTRLDTVIAAYATEADAIASFTRAEPA